MYYYLNGTLALVDGYLAVIDCGGVGYALTVSGNTLGKISGKTGEKIKLFTYMSVKEDDVSLFGFYSAEELSAFRMLLSVSGVGPKAAMSVLSLLTPERFALAVSTGDTKALSKAPGVGGKTAARIVLELKDKISKQISTDTVSSEDIVVNTSSGKQNDAENTLIVLGYSRAQALSALRGIDMASLSLEEIIKQALKKLM